MSEEERKPFDEAIVAELKDSIEGCLLKHPELRSVAVALDYRGGLNEADIQRGIWIGDEGPVQRPPAVIGSLAVTAQLMRLQLQRAEQLVAHLEQVMVRSGQEAVSKAKQPENGEKEESDAE